MFFHIVSLFLPPLSFSSKASQWDILYLASSYPFLLLPSINVTWLKSILAVTPSLLQRSNKFPIFSELSRLSLCPWSAESLAQWDRTAVVVSATWSNTRKTKHGTYIDMNYTKNGLLYSIKDLYQKNQFEEFLVNVHQF